MHDNGSLELCFLEEFSENINHIVMDMEKDLNDKECYVAWKKLERSFQVIKTEYNDYLSQFHVPENENFIKSSEFLMFKDNFIGYLRNFIRGIQRYAAPIRKKIIEFENSNKKEEFFNSVMRYEKDNIFLTNEYDEEKSYEDILKKYFSIKKWFIKGKNEAVCDCILNEADEIIKKITRYVIKIMDAENFKGKRTEDYKKLIELFNKCISIEEAGKLSSLIFGVISPKHIICNKSRTTESINSSIFNEEPMIFTIKPSNRYREKTASRIGVRDRSNVKNKFIDEFAEARKDERKSIEEKIKDNKFVFRKVENLTCNERNIFLKWLSDALNRKDDQWIKNEYGMYYRAIKCSENNEVLVRCNDGDFLMPDYELIFKEEV